jgi:deoxyadenosine/deoxycytidine kinase
LPKPELFVFLYVETPKLKQNILHRGRSYEQDIESSYLDKIQEGYFEFMKQSDLRILILDTNNIDFVNREEDYRKVVDAIDKEYPKGIHRITF